MAVIHHEPLRVALGLPSDFDGQGADDELLLQAAKEWHLEHVLGQPSPWRPPASSPFQGEHAATKERAFASLRERILAENSRSPNSMLRVLPVDFDVAAFDFGKSCIVMHGDGHGGDLTIDAWQPRGDRALVHRFQLGRGRARSAFAEDDAAIAYHRADVPTGTFRQFVVGAGTVVAARIVPWWCGPEWCHSWSSHDFVVAVHGIPAPPGVELAWCGYESSSERLHNAALTSVRDWHRSALADAARFAPAEVDAEARQLFVAAWLRWRSFWERDSGWWWVRERLVAMAGAFGNEALLPALLDHVREESAIDGTTTSRTAAAACTSLAQLTGVDLRFDAGGRPRRVSEAASAYRERLRKR